ncbi:MAG: c-type cytochrome domain-containing protein, partial [Verrucomicrobiales bacterium]
MKSVILPQPGGPSSIPLFAQLFAPGLVWWGLWFGLGLCQPASATDFDREIRHLLQERCLECHGEKKQKGGLRLDARVFAFKGGHDGPAIIPGKP